MARLSVRVQPRARDRGLVGWMADGTLKLKVREAAEAGAANRAVAELIAEVAGVRTAAVKLVRGQTTRAKTLEVEGLDEVELRRRIERRMPDGK